MEVIPGKRKNSFLYVYEGYTYNIDSRYNYIYRCAKRRINFCKGVLIKENEKYILSCEHSHPNEPHIIDIFKLKTEMIRMCKETTATNKEIFDIVSRRNPVAAANISFNAVRSLLLRERIKVRPALPQAISDFDRYLECYDTAKCIYKSYVISEDNKYSYIFTSDKLLQILDKSSEIFIDGTFSVVPKTPTFTQLFSVHVRYMDKGIAILFILCEARTQFVYKSIWKEIVKLAPNLQSNLRFIMMDYERASMNAVHEQFPNASLRGCWFHYCQAVLKKWKQLELLTAPDKIVSMAMALPLAPPEMFSEGLTLMQIIVDEESKNYPNLLLFIKYMRNTWLPISKKISVYKCPIRTNNLVESFHNIMLKRMHIHPNLWSSLDNLSKIIMDQEINYDRLVNGLQLTRERNTFNEYKNKKIQKAQHYLSNGIYSLKEFLQLFGKENLHKQHKIALLKDNDNEIEMCSDLYKEGVTENINAVPTNMNVENVNQVITDYYLENVRVENNPFEPEVPTNSDVENGNQIIVDCYLENITIENNPYEPEVIIESSIHPSIKNTSYDNNLNNHKGTKKEFQQCQVVVKKIDMQQIIQEQKRIPLSTIMSISNIPIKSVKRQNICDGSNKKLKKKKKLKKTKKTKKNVLN